MIPCDIDCFMIVIGDSCTSNYYADYCMPSWQSSGIVVNKFDAVTPATLYKHSHLKFAKYSSASKYKKKMY